MKILVACECSGRVRDAFARKGHEAWSCDVKKSEVQGHHLRFDAREVLELGWDMMIAFPPCTYLSYAGARWNDVPGRSDHTEAAVAFFMALANAPIDKIAIENPRGIMARRWRKPDDCIQPYYFGHHQAKRTYLWLKNLPGLMATQISDNPQLNWVESVHGADRSRTFMGVAEAMAAQWGGKQ